MKLLKGVFIGAATIVCIIAAGVACIGILKAIAHICNYVY